MTTLTPELRRARAESLGTGRSERRVCLRKVDLQESRASGSLLLTGYACLTGVPYDMGWYVETVRRGAFRTTLSRPGLDVVLNLDHGRAASGLPIARTTAGNLRLAEDNIGLSVSADLDPEDPDVELLCRKRRAGNLDGQMSMAFKVARNAWSKAFDERELIELNLQSGDVSCVVFAASPSTFSDVTDMDDVGRALAASTYASRSREAEDLDFAFQLKRDRIRLEQLRHPKRGT